MHPSLYNELGLWPLALLSCIMDNEYNLIMLREISTLTNSLPFSVTIKVLKLCIK